jgi:DNA segregation ATPase FtsK/SpoIIIE, S-DNA-T family
MAKKKKKKAEESHKKTLGRRAKNTIIVIILFAISFLNIAAFFNKAGILGKYFLQGSTWLLGGGKFLVPLFFITAALAILARLKKPLWLTLCGTLLLTLSSVSFLNVISQEKGGGFIGQIVGSFFIRYLDKPGAFIVIGALTLISLVLVFNLSLGFLFKKQAKDKETEKIEEKQEKVQTSLNLQEEKPSLLRRLSNKETKILHRPIFKLKKLEEDNVTEQYSKGKKASRDEDQTIHKEKIEGYEFPSLELLTAELSDKEGVKKSEINENMEIIQETLRNFGIEVTMGDVSVGPTVTQYTLKPAQGVRLSKIVARHNDLALALAAHPLRIEAPIPGKSLVGIEVPNRNSHWVKLRDLLEAPAYKEKKAYLTLPLGKDVSGEPFYDNLARMPHLLIAGSTGTGKSVAIHNILTALLYQNSPRSLRLILVDPKRVELTLYNNIPHLLTPVIQDAQKAINSLKWAISEMERRYELLSQMEARNISSYNKQIEKKKQKSLNGEEHKFLPYIVIVIDELADIMLHYSRETEAAIVRLAQMARAVGIHLILSTQRPSVEVITGLIKANITFRIAFQVASQIDSRTIIDAAGAEKLLGNGDMLYQTGDSSKPHRIQGAFLADREVKRVVKFLRRQDYEDSDSVDLGDVSQEKSINVATFHKRDMEDELYPDAKKIVIEARKGSASLLERRLRIGYTRAARLLDMLEEDGIVGPSRGSKARQVLAEQDKHEVI